MNGRLKFRVWNKEEKRFINFGDMPNREIEFNFDTKDNYFLIECDPGKYKILQYTGILDKNGKRIFEADILRDSLKDKLYRVAWIGCRAGFEIVEILQKQSTGYTPPPGTMYLTNQSFNRFAIIGNIYENPELLEVNNEHT